MSGQTDPEELEAVSMDEDALCEEVLDLYSREGMDGVLDGMPGLRSMAGCRALVHLGHELRYVDPDRSAACMACAEILSSRLGSAETGKRELEDFRCEMALELVWSRIDLQQTDAADAALARAAERFLNGTRGDVLAGRLLDTWAVLHGSRLDYVKARQAARAALARFEKAGERHDQGRMLYRLSLIEERCGEETRTEESLRCVSEALTRLDASVEPDLYLSAVHRRVGCLVDLERYREARIRLFESLEHHRRHGNALDELQRAVLEGLSNAGLGKLHAAERELITALFGLCATGDAYLFGLLALELCAMYFDQGREAEVRAGALRIMPVFETLPLPAGGRKALLYLEASLEDGTADADLLRRTARYLRELQHDREARFRPRA